MPFVFATHMNSIESCGANTMDVFFLSDQRCIRLSLAVEELSISGIAV